MAALFWKITPRINSNGFEWVRAFLISSPSRLSKTDFAWIITVWSQTTTQVEKATKMERGTIRASITTYMWILHSILCVSLIHCNVNKKLCYRVQTTLKCQQRTVLYYTECIQLASIPLRHRLECWDERIPSRHLLSAFGFLFPSTASIQRDPGCLQSFQASRLLSPCNLPTTQT